MSIVPPSELGGAAEVVAELGCHKQQLVKIRQRKDFPAPIVVLAATPIWDLRAIRAFKDSWRRRNRALDKARSTE